MNLPSPGRKGCPPGEIAAFSILVAGTGSRPIRLAEAVTGPEGWVSLFPAGEFTLSGPEPEARLLGVQIPSAAAAGDYAITYTVFLVGHPEVAAAIDVPLRVLEKPRFEMSVERGPDKVVAGESYPIVLRLFNRGNVGIVVETRFSSSSDFPVDPPVALTELAPQTGYDLEFRVGTSKGLRWSTSHNIGIVSQIVGEQGGGHQIVRNVATEVIPPAGGGAAAMVIFPVRVNISGMRETGASSWLGTLDGKGYLDEQNERQLDLVVRGPDTRQRSVFGKQEEFRARFTSGRMSLQVGDHYYSLSRLTNNATYGRGGSVRMDLGGGMAVGGHYSEDRQDHAQRQWAAFLETRPGSWASLKGNFLEKEDPSSGTGRQRILSLESGLGRGRPENLDLEAAFSGRRGAVFREEGSYRVFLKSERRLSSAHFERVFGGPDFRGYYSDREQVSGLIRLKLGRALSPFASFQRGTGVRPGGFEDRLAQGGLVYRPGGGATIFSFEGRYWETRPPDLDNVPGHTDRSLRAGLGFLWSRTTFSTYLEAGEQQTRGTVEVRPIARASVLANINFSGRNSLFLQGQLSDPKDQGGGILGSGTFVSGSLSLNPARALKLSFRVSANDLGSRVRQENVQIDGGAVGRLARDLSVDIRWRYGSRQGFPGVNSFMVAVIRGLGVPVARTASAGGVQGIVTNAESPDGKGIAGIQIRLQDLVATTGRDGTFEFPAVKPGYYTLTVDRATMGMGYVADVNLPLALDVIGGRTEKVEIGIVRSTCVQGRIATYASTPGEGNAAVTAGAGLVSAADAEPSLFVEGASGRSVRVPPGLTPELHLVGGLANILIELSNGTRVLHKYTDDKGCFAFPDLYPGSWTLKVVGRTLPPHHILETDELKLKLAPGTTEEVALRVLPRLRSIQILDQGNLRVSRAE